MKTVKLFGLFAFIATLNYYYILGTGAVGDDYSRIMLSDLDRFLNVLIGPLSDRPLLMLSLWVDKFLYGFNLFFWRLESLMWHALVGWQIYRLILELDGRSERTARYLAILFILHPLNNQTILLIVQRGVIFSTLLGLLAIRHFIRGNHTQSTLSFLASVLCKPITLFLPVHFSTMNRSFRYSWKIIALYFIPVLVPIFYYVILKRNSQAVSYSAMEYFVVQGEAILNYFRLILLPVGMQYLYDIHIPQTIWPNFGYLLFIIATYFGLRRATRSKEAKWMLNGFFLSFLPESSFFPIHHFSFDHRTYLPLSLLTVFAAMMINDYELWKKKHFRFAFILLAFTYFVLNQVRNFQVTPASNWVLHNFEHQTKDHYNNFQSASRLLDLGVLDEMRPQLDRLLEVYPKQRSYRILDLVWRLKKKSNPQLLNALSQELGQELEYDFQRAWGNSFLINYMHRGESVEEKIFLENLLSRQLVYFFDQRQGFVYGQIRDFYLQMTQEIVRKQLVQGTELLRMKTILNYYFRKDFPGLKGQVRAALLKDPENIMLLRLDEMLQKD